MEMEKLAVNFSKRAKWYDYSILKASVFFFTLFLITAWADFRNLIMGVHYAWYLLVAIIFSLYLMKKMFMK